jgi:hypothetical protein
MQNRFPFPGKDRFPVIVNLFWHSQHRGHLVALGSGTSSPSDLWFHVRQQPIERACLLVKAKHMAFHCILKRRGDLCHSFHSNNLN